MLDWLYEFLGTLLYWFSQIFGGNYVFGLILYALLFKLLFIPFTIKQQKNQIKSARLAPKIALIKAKYKGRNDRVTQQKMQQEIMDFQQKEGYSPFSGCLPLLLQMPIILLLYKVIRYPLSYVMQIAPEKIEEIYARIHPLVEGQEKVVYDSIDQIQLMSDMQKHSINALDYGAIADRALPDLHLGILNMGEFPSFASLLVIIPILVALSQWFTMWITKKINGNPMMLESDQQNQTSLKIMDLVMPLMTLWFAFNMPALLGVYWIYQSVFSILQTLIMAKAMPIPKFTEEDVKALRKAEKEAEKINRQALKEQPKTRSLHYIDEDDYEELPEVKSNTQPQKNNKSTFGDTPPEIKD